MIIDEKGKIFGRISIIDILLISLVLAISIFALNKLGFRSSKETITTVNSKAKIVFFQEEINDFSVENIQLGDPASESLRNVAFGKVTDIEVGESISWNSDLESNQLISTPREGYSSIYITMETNATVGPNGIVIGGSTFYIGETITLRAGNAIFFGRIYSAEKI